MQPITHHRPSPFPRELFDDVFGEDFALGCIISVNMAFC
jgi:hypothetical protein